MGLAYAILDVNEVYNIDLKNKLIFNAVGGSDKIEIEGESRPDLKGAENVNHSGYQYTTGLTYKALLSKNSYTLFSVGKTTSSWLVDVYSLDADIKNTYFTRDNIESDDFIKWDIGRKI